MQACHKLVVAAGYLQPLGRRASAGWSKHDALGFIHDMDDRQARSRVSACGAGCECLSEGRGHLAALRYRYRASCRSVLGKASAGRFHAILDVDNTSLSHPREF